MKLEALRAKMFHIKKVLMAGTHTREYLRQMTELKPIIEDVVKAQHDCPVLIAVAIICKLLDEHVHPNRASAKLWYMCAGAELMEEKGQ